MYAPTYKYDSHTRLVLESKAEMRGRDVSSPDEWDAVALTFAADRAARLQAPDRVAGARHGVRGQGIRSDVRSHVGN